MKKRNGEQGQEQSGPRIVSEGKRNQHEGWPRNGYNRVVRAPVRVRGTESRTNGQIVVDQEIRIGELKDRLIESQAKGLEIAHNYSIALIGPRNGHRVDGDAKNQINGNGERGSQITHEPRKDRAL